MTPVGHSLMGVTIAVVCLPSKLSKTASFLGLTNFVVLANLPDAPLPGWGHDRYGISHSVFVNVALIAGLVLVLRRAWPRLWRVFAGGAVAWLSHLLLDTLYNHGRGLAMFWPMSQARLVLPVPWFSILHDFPPSLNSHNLRVFGVEILVYGALLGVALVWRYWSRRNAV